MRRDLIPIYNNSVMSAVTSRLQFRSNYDAYPFFGVRPNFLAIGQTRGESGGLPPCPLVLSQILGRTPFFGAA